MKRTFVPSLLVLLIVSMLAGPLLAAEKKKDPLANWKTKFDYSKAEYTYILSNISHPVIQGVANGCGYLNLVYQPYFWFRYRHDSA